MHVWRLNLTKSEKEDSSYSNWFLEEIITKQLLTKTTFLKGKPGRWRWGAPSGLQQRQDQTKLRTKTHKLSVENHKKTLDQPPNCVWHQSGDYSRFLKAWVITDQRTGVLITAALPGREGIQTEGKTTKGKEATQKEVTMAMFSFLAFVVMSFFYF